MKKDTIIAIIRGVDPGHVVEITQALLDSGISWLEVSLSEEEKGLECIRRISQAFPNQVHLGVGTVSTPSQVDASLKAGANYIITPGWDRELAKYVRSKKVTMFPGVFSPGEIMQAASLGIDTVKLFPVVNLGTSFIKNVSGPFPRMNWMAVGGVNKRNILELRSAGCSSFAIGSELVPRGATTDHLEAIKQAAISFQQLLLEECIN